VIRRPATSRRRGPRSRDEIAVDRRQLEEEVDQVINQLCAEFHALLSRDQAKATGAVYARYSTRFQHSIADQVRGCLETAVKQDVFVPRENIFFDLAVRGCKERRPGLQRLRELLSAKVVQTVLIFTTNRLFRKNYKALQFVEEELVERGIRCLFIKSGVDTADEKRWRMLLQIHAMTDEYVAGMYADNIRAAQEGLFRKKLVAGTITFGYRAKEVLGAPTRRQRPRAEYEIDPETSEWVRRIYDWYVEGGLTMAAIVQRLNGDDQAPLGPRAVSGRWTRTAVRLLLSNSRYRGTWVYGKTKIVWQAKKDYSRQVERDQPLQEQQFEELRIITDETWFKAQRRLTAEYRPGGRKSKDGDRYSRPRLLIGIFRCPEHDRRLHVGGVHGRFLVCPVCKELTADKRPLFSQLNRRLAVRLTCRKLADLIRADDDLVKRVVTNIEQEASGLQQPNPKRVEEVKSRHAQLGHRIQFVLTHTGETSEDQREAEAVLRQLRAERASVASELATLEKQAGQPVLAPTEEQVRTLIIQMGQVLEDAALQTDENLAPARELIDLLTGGRIDLEQQGERRPQRGWLRGRFRVRLLTAVVSKLAGVALSADGDGVEVTIDYREPTEAEQWADRVKERYDRGQLINVIAAELGIRRNLARLALAAWSERTGEVLPDGRSRRQSLANPQSEPPLYQRVADAVKRLLDEGILMQEVAQRLNIDRNTMTAAMRFWYRSRGLEAPDGRGRRKELPRKVGLR
jgi:DNA invertase Pin-like site-specific DNA recombinase